MYLQILIYYDQLLENKKFLIIKLKIIIICDKSNWIYHINL